MNVLCLIIITSINANCGTCNCVSLPFIYLCGFGQVRNAFSSQPLHNPLRRSSSTYLFFSMHKRHHIMHLSTSTVWMRCASLFGGHIACRCLLSTECIVCIAKRETMQNRIKYIYKGVEKNIAQKPHAATK